MTIEGHSTDTGILAGLATSTGSHRAHPKKTQENKPIDFRAYVPELGPRFEILERMRDDATGLVFKVYDIEFDRLASVKILPYFGISQSVEARIMRDCNAMVGVHHPNILEVYDYGKSLDGAPYLVLEFFQGESLASLIDRNHGLDPVRAESILIQIAEALSCAHRMGIIHRDIRPSNVLIVQKADGQDIIKVIDFGIAKTVVETIPAGLRAGVSPDDGNFYNSPEQIRGNVFDPRCDIYSLGCLMYEVVSGRPPFKDNEGHLHQKPAPLTKKSSGQIISSRLESCILRCLEKQPQERFKYADAVIYHLTSKVVHEQSPKLGRRIAWTKLVILLICASTVSIPFLVSRNFSLPLWLCLTVYAVAVFLVILAVVQNLDLGYRLRTRSKPEEQDGEIA